ncbi:deoxyribose-phosphate aldolase [Roseibium hamelinense]|uniref:Deoxyribose-phosphate aldolase n=1 Tax=Roseibium hamelinense TaxID=150831 RepID=A0A562SHI3_9HYPH|nr:deoxyribose-phosphate aldolase [Roseibium hamelinense]MTI43938.1 deoxyribose-phosphate aldolase [Roseibium hamelinense]TWI80767.1 deoxyribose-phosphate aldolase [Roseibium hamelinense]
MSEAMDPKDVAARALPLVDLTNLNDDCTAEDITALCKRAVTAHGTVAAVCIWPQFVAQAVAELSGSGVRVATVVNFPAGGTETLDVVAETAKAVADGADDIDLVMPYRAFLDGRRGFAEEQIIQVKAAIPQPKILKVILETGEIKDPLLIHSGCQIAIGAGADFIKTSTGKVETNATLEAAEIMLTAIEEARRDHKKSVGFKPAGGIKTVQDAADYLALADRILGHNWVSAQTFRFGASGLLDALIGALDGTNATAGEGY